MHIARRQSSFLGTYREIRVVIVYWLQAADECQPGHAGCAVKRACLALEKVKAEKGGSEIAVRAVREVFDKYGSTCASKEREALVWEAEFTLWKELAANANKTNDSSMAKAAEAAMLECAEKAHKKDCDTLTLITEHVDALLQARAGKSVLPEALAQAEERARAATNKYPQSVEAWSMWVRVHAR